MRRFATKEFKLDLRVGLAPLTALISRDTEVLVGRYEPAPASAYAVFLGNGVDLMESSVKGRGDDSLATLGYDRRCRRRRRSAGPHGPILPLDTTTLSAR